MFPKIIILLFSMLTGTPLKITLRIWQLITLSRLN